MLRWHFVNDELVAYSEMDVGCSIPFVVDGLKVSKRKIVSHALKRNVTSDLKVAQFAASVTEAMPTTTEKFRCRTRWCDHAAIRGRGKLQRAFAGPCRVSSGRVLGDNASQVTCTSVCFHLQQGGSSLVSSRSFIAAIRESSSPARRPCSASRCD